MSHPVRRSSLLFLTLVTVASVGIIVTAGMHFASYRLADFAGYYTAGRSLADGIPADQLYDDSLFQARMEMYDIHEPTISMYVNPPTVGAVFLPLSNLDPFTAKFIWNCINIVLIIAAWRILTVAFQLQVDSWLQMLLLLLLAGSVPFLRNIQLGQMYVLMLLLCSTLFHCYLRRNTIGVALSISSLFLLKMYGWPFLILFAIERRWRDLGFSLAAIILGLGASIAVFGFESYQMQWTNILNMTGSSDTASLSLRSVVAPLGRLFIAHELWNPLAVVHIPWLPALLTSILFAGGLGTTFLRRHTGERDRFLAILILSVIFTPLAADHHYILLGIPAYLVMASCIQKSDLRRIFLYGTVVYLLLGWFPFMPGIMSHGWSSLFAYTRLYAAVALFFLITSNSDNERKTEIASLEF